MPRLMLHFIADPGEQGGGAVLAGSQALARGVGLRASHVAAAFGPMADAPANDAEVAYAPDGVEALVLRRRDELVRPASAYVQARATTALAAPDVQ